MSVLPVRALQQEDRSSVDQTGLRTALRDVPILPAPGSVEELIARMDDAAPFPSGALAEIILDARYPDMEPGPFGWSKEGERSRDNFFAPIASPANSNDRRLGATLISRLFDFIIKAAVLAGAFLIVSNALQSPNVSPPSVSGPSATRLAPAMPSASVNNPQEQHEVGEQSPLPSTKPKADEIEALVQLELPEVEPVLPSQPSQWTDPTVETRMAVVHEPPELTQAIDPVVPDADIELEPVPAIPDPVIEPIFAVSAIEHRIQTRITAPVPPIRPKARASVPYAGIWATTPEACASKTRQDDLLTYINARRGRAGDTTCSFKKTRRSGDGWDISAACSDGQTNWGADVRLSLRRGRLTWTSQKGSTTYMRCNRG